jgi:hypothetical protein
LIAVGPGKHQFVHILGGAGRVKGEEEGRKLSSHHIEARVERTAVIQYWVEDLFAKEKSMQARRQAVIDAEGGPASTSFICSIRGCTARSHLLSQSSQLS